MFHVKCRVEVTWFMYNIEPHVSVQRLNFVDGMFFGEPYLYSETYLHNHCPDQQLKIENNVDISILIQ